MPKRPCAIALTPDESTILCGDKFGDVYALPLLGESAPQEAVIDSESTQTVQSSPKPFAPTANTKTVHSKRNLEALKNQQRMTPTRNDKEVPRFEHRLLLGHVSLLTDMISTSLSASASSFGRSRTYILTADRDEHIRISRGVPQAHIIEGYCLGHSNFISKLCIPKRHERLLVSGGGDDHIHLWDWVSQKPLLRFDLKSIVQEIRTPQPNITQAVNEFPSKTQLEAVEHIAVSGIWTYRHEDQETLILVACEA